MLTGGGVLSQPPSEESAISSISVTFNGNGGSSSSTTRTFTNGSQVSNLPTASRSGYTFGGWYKKKNYITESVMDSFMNWINRQESNDPYDTPYYINKTENVYSWDVRAGAHGENGDIKYIYSTGIRLTGTYRLTYDAYNNRANGTITSYLRVYKGDTIVMGPPVNTSSWASYQGEATFNNEEVRLATGWYDGGMTYFKNIRLERIDTDGVLENKLQNGDTIRDNYYDKLTYYARWIEVMKVDPAGGYHSNNLISGASTNTSCAATNNMNLSYTASTGTYTLTNTSSSDPYAVLVQTAYLTKGTTYRMHVTLSSTASRGIQIFYAINNGFTESQSLRFTSTDQELTFTVPSTGTYNLRMDNDTDLTTIRITNFYIATVSTSSSVITYGNAYGTGYQQLVPPTRSGYIFNGWISLSTPISGNVAWFTAGATISAQWTEVTYSLTVNFDSTTSWSNAPDSVKIEVVGGASSTISKGGKWTTTLGYTSFSSAKTIRATVTSSSHSYYVSFNANPTTSSSVGSASTTWGARTNLTVTLYVYQRYTISFDKGYADDGTVPSSIYKIHGTNVTLPTNSLTHKGFTPNGWNSIAAGTGASYTTSYNLNSGVTLYPNWTPVYANVNITIVTLNRNGEVIQTTGGSISATRKYASNNQASGGTETSSYTTLIEYTSTITATANSGYVFLGFNTTRTVPKPTTTPNRTYSITPTGSETYNIYVYFQQISDNQLKYDSKEKYWYFEDGMYPQSEVDSSLAATLNSQSFSVAEYTLQYNNGTEQTVNVYTYDGKQYALVEINSVRKWFAVEPIRWRVSEYGVSEDVKPDLWQNYGDTKSLVAVSDKILFASIMTADRINDSKLTESKDFWLNNYVTTGEFQLSYDGSFSHSQDSFLGAGRQDVSQSGTVSTNVAVYSNSDTTLSKHTAKLTAFTSFLLYGTTAYADTYDAYWTRDLETDGRSEYGCGVVVTSYGSETLRWLNQMCGVRLTYYCTEVSRY